METSRAVQKAAIRSDIKAKLRFLPPEYVHDQSSRVCSKLFNHKSFIQSRAICVYLSMTSEVQTYDIVRKCFEDGKRLFIPKVTGKRSEDMFVLELESVAQIDSFPRSKWGIPEPPMELVNMSTDATSLGLIDTVIVPGVAFDGSCGRMGHGKGYYDCFLDRLYTVNKEQGAMVPFTIGVALDEQIVDAVPQEPHDQRLDFVISPTRIYSRDES